MQNSSPASLSYDLLEITLTLAQVYRMDVFNILHQNADDVILIINHFVEKSEMDESQDQQPAQQHDDFWDYV